MVQHTPAADHSTTIGSVGHAVLVTSVTVSSPAKHTTKDGRAELALCGDRVREWSCEQLVGLEDYELGRIATIAQQGRQPQCQGSGTAATASVCSRHFPSELLALQRGVHG